MSEAGDPRSNVPRNVALIVLAVAGMVVLVLALVPGATERFVAAAPPAVEIAAADAPIAAEADVFRTAPGDLAAGAAMGQRREAHRRTLAMFRALRAYPGAPPRIPHGLTEQEYRGSSCNVCHERGGYVARFASYAPVTPHPEYTACLQCHVPDDAVVGVSFPDDRPDAVCLQCHRPDAAAQPFVPHDWRTTTWPQLGRTALPGGPPVIPHDPELRGNCVACHAGPGSVLDIRTTHAERAGCRQCHLQAGEEVDVFVRPAARRTAATGGSP